eukprot:CAMPEP_0177695196 /NCGR_PEP_ID=MMETSP0484_2-20121128/3331_1 /TAXON_ID=354590 /ORGANISM="Rhodomonas lens, Strain RHODO" /LENGTH=63 /DNA_ID=CAMNT_0019206111 /DNA_START=1576 /DNA_END=1767 /DNA_ORIENTATION=+
MHRDLPAPYILHVAVQPVPKVPRALRRNALCYKRVRVAGDALIPQPHARVQPHPRLDCSARRA